MNTVRVGKGVWFMGQTIFVHFAKSGDFTNSIRLLSLPISYWIPLVNSRSFLTGIIPAYINRTVAQKLLVLL